MTNKDLKVINLTPHEVTVFLQGDTDPSEAMVIPPSGEVARCEQKDVFMGIISGIPIYKSDLGDVKNLPDSQDDTIYLVSTPVAEKLKAVRDDLYVPAGFVRNERGQIQGCTFLAKH